MRSSAPLTSVAATPDGRTVVAGGVGVIHVLRGPALSPDPEVSVNLASRVKALVFVGPQTFAAGLDDATIRLYSTGGTQLGALERHLGR